MRSYRSSLLVWGMRLIGMTMIALQLWSLATGAASAVEMVARGVILAGYAITLRAHRVGGAVMLLGCALLSIAIYTWAGALGSTGSAQLAFHTLPPMAIGLLHLCLPIRVEHMQPAMANM